MIEKFSGTYCNIPFRVSKWDYNKFNDLKSILLKYLPGIHIDQQPVDREKVAIEIDYILIDKKEDEDGVWEDVNENNVKACVKAHLYYEFIILGILTTAFDFILQYKGVYFLHSAAGRIGSNGVIFLGKRADGKSTIARKMREMGIDVIHDDRVCIIDGDFTELNMIPFLRIDEVKCLITPKILSCDRLQKWNVNHHSLRYELFCEFSDKVRAIGTIESRIVFQSIDNKELSARRLDFVTRMAKNLSDKAFFVEGNANQIICTAEKVME